MRSEVSPSEATSEKVVEVGNDVLLAIDAELKGVIQVERNGFYITAFVALVFRIAIGEGYSSDFI